MKDIINEFENKFVVDGKPEWIGCNIPTKLLKDFLQKAISQTQKEAYEKGRLETIKEIEEKLPSEQSIGGEEFLVMDTFNKYQVLGHNECLSKIKSILNQLKDNE